MEECIRVSPSRIDYVTEPGKPIIATVAVRDVGESREWIRDNKDAIRSVLDEHGVLYLRGLSIGSAADFREIRDVLIDTPAPYQEKATPRSDFGGGVLSSTDFPADQRIAMHNENSYVLTFPGVLIFCCLTSPAEGGATPVADVRRVLEKIPQPLVRRFREVGWGLRRNYVEHLGLSWQTAFASQSPDAVAEYCRSNQIHEEWLDDARLRTTQRRSATIRHPRTGEETWFNHVAFWSEWSLDPDFRQVLIESFGADGLPFNTYFGDGERIEREHIDAINEAYRAATVRETWQPGDVMIVDNMLAAHGRDPYQGDRRILVAMGNLTSARDCSPTVELTGQLTR
jgi:alpha-ketoglutarate-dependent taurine dioxygenase